MLTDYNDFYSEINKYKYNVVAYCCTPWHIKGTEAAIEYLSEKIEVNPLILLVDDGVFTRNPKKEMFSLEFQRYRIEYVKGFRYFEGGSERKNNIYRLLTILFNYRKDVLYIINPVLNFRWNTYIKTFCNKDVIQVVIDDGGGGHVGYNALSPRWRFGQDFKTWYKVCLWLCIHKELLIDFRITDKKFGLIGRDVGASDYYKKQLIDYSKSSVKNQVSSFFCNKIIINSQPFKEYGSIKDGEDVDTYSILYNILGDLNSSVVVKPHPQEIDYEKYKAFGWRVLETGNMSQEEILANMDGKPKCIISITSSVLINTKVLFGTRTISLAYIVAKIMKNEKKKKETEMIASYFSNIMDVPRDENELKEIISSLKC